MTSDDDGDLLSTVDPPIPLKGGVRDAVKRQSRDPDTRESY